MENPTSIVYGNILLYRMW